MKGSMSLASSPIPSNFHNNMLFFLYNALSVISLDGSLLAIFCFLLASVDTFGVFSLRVRPPHLLQFQRCPLPHSSPSPLTYLPPTHHLFKNVIYTLLWISTSPPEAESCPMSASPFWFNRPLHFQIPLSLSPPSPFKFPFFLANFVGKRCFSA